LNFLFIILIKNAREKMQKMKKNSLPVPPFLFCGGIVL